MTKKNTADQIVRAVRRIEDRSNIRAYVILRDGAHVGTVRIQFPRDGAGKLHACAADWTLDMPEGVDFKDWTRWQYGWATGYGYDKATAALGGMTIDGVRLADQGHHWSDQLRKAGLQVIQAI